MKRATSRRAVLAGAGLAVTSAGCVGRVRNIVGRNQSGQLSLEITTVPADGDPNAIRIARHLSKNLNASGINAPVNTMTQADLKRKVLLNHDFDLYIGQFPETEPFDPDALYPFLHSQFTAETGWQNPFGFTELAVDDLLERQRRVDDQDRMDVIAELQDTVCELQPFTVVALPDALTAYREGSYTGWEGAHPTSAQGLLQLSHVDPPDDDDPSTLRLTTTDDRITENWNPIAAEYRRHGMFIALLYDPLIRQHEGESIPWLARRWEWIDRRTVRVELRESVWHDGEMVTADDVAFTYAFLKDTSMGGADSPIPTPRFRGQSSLVEDVIVLDDSTLKLSLGIENRSVGERALQVPILPEHIWSEHTGTATIAGIEVDSETTEALVWNNEDPVGNGPLRFVESTPESEVVFQRNEKHFLQREGGDDDALATGDGGDEETDGMDGAETSDGTETTDDGGTTAGDDEGTDDGGDVDGGGGGENGGGSEAGSGNAIPDVYLGNPSFERLVVEVVPSDIAAVQLVGDGNADGTASNLGPDAVPRIGRESDARLASARSAAFYHVGYNTRRAPLSNPRFRAVLASMIDKSALVEDAFQGYAEPAASPLAASPEFVPERLRWDDERDEDPVHPFRGNDGELDVEAVRDAFRDAGYRFNDSGELLARDQ